MKGRSLSPVAPVVLVILDGWGENPATNHNAIRLAKTPVMDALWHAYPHTLIQASGAHVGLPEGQMGNSEVGHLTIGSGRVIRQELVRISEEVKKGQFKQNQALNGMAAKLLESGGTLHLLGLLSDGGVHSHINHIGGLLKWAAAKKLKRVCIHGITDGRDTPTNSSIGFIKTLQQQIEAAGVGELTSRPDRMRQLTSCLVNPNFSGFERQLIQSLDVVTFTQYEKDQPVAVAFPPESLDDLLGEVISRNGLRQFRTAETEKYPHVTYFLNGGMEKPYPGEDRHLVPSPKVATYDQSPAMSAAALTNGCVAAIRKGIYSFVVINYANPDMVGHTGDLNATIEAISCVDQCIGKLLSATGRMGGTLLITADHGNAELMQGADGRPWTAHTTNPVPFILVEGEQRKLAGLGGDIQLRADAGLADIAPTVLELLGIEVPEAMSGTSLVANNRAIQSTPTLV
ncbi:MAG: 2,3-bisphosphoglycerate-independent phosphoglycerate mutase [Synechococcaceae bacterium WBB_32_011]|nr:2,3-bisphosphoglycerate-independent phosphoglycerate mutase [Synechococcaceae bacterium WBB_32_011]